MFWDFAFFRFFVVFQGGWLFGFLSFVAFTWVFVAFVAFNFASSAFTVPLFSHPLHCQFCCVTGRFGFVAFGFSHPLLSQLVFGLGFLHPQHRKFLSGAPA